MEQREWSTFREYLDGTFEQYGKQPLTDRGAMIMFNNLRDLDLQTVLGGLNLHVRMNRFVPPNAASVRELIADECAARAFDKARSARKVAKSSDSVRFEDPLIHLAIERCGGWPEFFFMGRDEGLKQFLPAYSDAFRKQVDARRLPDHLAGEREARGGVFDPWKPEQIVDVDARITDGAHKLLTA